jgi:2-polyprenyl-3-methyl-5-hydroxy-6-metoxy-1,4-benzoquinol methylase
MMPRGFANTSDFIRWNEAMSQKYDSESYHLRSSFIIRWIERRRRHAIVCLLGAETADSVLEVGCGAGVILEKIPAGRLLGIDLSGFILQKTKRRLARYRADLIQANGEQLPLPANSLRQIVCTEVIEHVLNPRNVVEEMARVATADAVLVITIPNEALIDRIKRIVGKLGLQRWLLQGAGDEAHGAAAYDSPDSANEWHLHHFDMALLRQVTRGVLSITAVKAIPFRLLPLRYVVSCRVVPTGT